MDFNDVPLFIRIVETGSLSAVAEELGIQRSSVSRALARLEQSVGVRLLQRTTRKLVVTDAGQLFFDRVRGAVAGLGDAIDAVREFGGEPRGVVRMTAPPDAQQIGIGDAIAAFARRYPAIQLELSLSARVVDLVGEGFDLAVRAGRLADSSLIARKVGESRMMLFASPSYLEEMGEPRTLAELARHRHILYRARAGKAALRMTGPKGEETIEVAGNISADDMAFLQHACIAGAGIALLPIELARKAASIDQLRLVLPHHAVTGGSVFVVLPSSRFVPSRVELLRDHLVAHLQRELADAEAECKRKDKKRK